MSERNGGTERGGSGGPAVARGRPAVAASILAVVLVGAYFAASRGELGSLPPGFLISAAVLGVAFWFPAVRLGSARDVLESWLPLGVWLLAWTLVWDLATAGVTGTRPLFSEWWIVYPSGVLVPAALLALHGTVVGRRR